MPKRTDLKTILIIGAGPIVIGQACEFDYSGAQACKALKEEGFRVVLVNSNPATIMTDPGTADAVYIEPINWQTVEKIIAKERPDALLPTMGGQTALNCALDLADNGVLEKYGVAMIGANRDAIRTAEDRELFKQAMQEIGLACPKAEVARSYEQAVEVQAKVGFPTIIRPSFTLGGSGGGIAYNVEEFEEIVKRGLELSPTHEVLVEESVLGWKELEMEVVRDRADNCIIVCSIENLDPMGVHTGDSITVAPAQTLTDKEYQRLRNASIAVLRKIGVETGGSNVQFAINPADGRLAVIEMNPRVSRSSALASKATGFPIAKIAAKLAVGYTLDELRNDITGGRTPASFEPTIDYVVTKVPRFAFEKFPQTDSRLTTQMKSVGEVMAMGRNFGESLQKALRGLETGKAGLDPTGLDLRSEDDLVTLRRQLRETGPERLFYVADAFRAGLSLEEINALSSIDPWFLHQIRALVDAERETAAAGLAGLDRVRLLELKRQGFSDARLARLLGTDEAAVRALRHAFGLRPSYKRVDSCAAEFATDTAYLYSTYGEECEAEPSSRDKIMVLGGGPNRIGQGIEFDYCCVHAALALREDGYETIMVNCNPETVRPALLRAADAGGRAGNRRAGKAPRRDRAVRRADAAQAGARAGGRRRAGDRHLARFDRPGRGPRALPAPDRRSGPAPAAQPHRAHRRGGARRRARDRLSAGGAPELRARRSRHGSGLFRRRPFALHPRCGAGIRKFAGAARPLPRQCRGGGRGPHRRRRGRGADRRHHAAHRGGRRAFGRFVLLAAAVFALAAIQDRLREQVAAMARGLNVIGLMNTQFAIQGEDIFVLEVNPRASRTVPFVSKATGVALAKIAARCMAGQSLAAQGATREVVPPYTSVKEAVFPFAKFQNVDPILGPEMRSTGEVMGVGVSFNAAFARAQEAANIVEPPRGKAFVSVRDPDKARLLPLARELLEHGFSLVATGGTAKVLNDAGFPCERVNKVAEGRPHIVDLIKNGEIVYIVNTTEGRQAIADSFSIRRSALQQKVTYSTTMTGAVALVDSLASRGQGDVHSLQELHARLAAGGSGEHA